MQAQFNLLCFGFSAFLLPCLFLPLTSSADLATDEKALLAFKENLQNQDNTALASWSNSTTSGLCTNWTGITCGIIDLSSSTSQRVILLHLPDASLSGQIPPSTLGSLSALKNLSLNSNRFFGELPSDLYNLTSLTTLLLQNNSFSGPLPASAFVTWPLLVQIDLSFNSFNGSIPESITNASFLQSVNLQNNSFSGQIPEVKSSNLESFNVANNELRGQIPSSLARFPALSFAGNGELCGKPLNEACNLSSPAPANPPENITGNQSKKTKKLSDGAIVGIVIGTALGGCMLFLLCGLIRSRRNSIGRTPSSRVNPSHNIEDGSPPASLGDGTHDGGGGRGGGHGRGGGGGGGGGEQSVMGEDKLVFVGNKSGEAFDIDKLLSASAEVMGNGSLGIAYKAMLETALDNDLVVVVKRLNFKYKGDYKRHLNELGSLRHQNLVPIKAWYFFQDEKLLVYEYIHGSSLQALLHGPKRMEWNGRLRVAAAAANALAAMHQRQVAHGNIKSSNVLIDSENEAHLTNYGLVQLALNLPLKSSAMMSIGYTAPEILNLSRASFESDVFSFGVLLLELLTGRSPVPIAGRPNASITADLPRWVQSVVQEQWTAEVFDLEIMRFEVVQEEMIELLQIALPCVSPSPANRPSMSDLAKSINNFLRPVDEDSGSASE